MRFHSYMFRLLLFFATGCLLFAACKKNNTALNYNSDKSKLKALIDSVTAVYGKAAEGSKPGNYSVGSKAVLNTSLGLASQVNSGSTFTQEDVDNAIANLRRSTLDFQSKLIQEVSVANLVAQWKFDGNANDASGHGYNGQPKTGWTGSNAATAVDGGTLPTLVADRFNRAGMAYDFDKGAHIEVPYNAALNPQNITLSLWLRRRTTNSNNYLVSLNRWNGFKFQLQGNNFLFMTFRADNGYHDVDSNPGVIPQDTWTHAAMSYTNGTMKFYVNGALVKSVAVTGAPLTLATPINLAIGNQLPKSVYTLTSGDFQYGGENFFIGSLDDIRFYNTALTDAEVLSIYTIEKSL